MKEKLTENLKKSVNTTLKVIRKKVAEAEFLFASSMYYLIDKDKNKVFNGIIDEENMFLYVRASKEKFFKENIEVNSIIKTDEETPKRYSVTHFDFDKTYDYLVKVKDKYHTVKCYKIKIENAA